MAYDSVNKEVVKNTSLSSVNYWQYDFDTILKGEDPVCNLFPNLGNKPCFINNELHIVSYNNEGDLFLTKTYHK